jgi:alpha-N-acetylglucosamine transferase
MLHPYDLVCELDLEGIVAKRLDGAYRIVEPLPWRKIKNPSYSQKVGRHELFERRRSHIAVKRFTRPIHKPVHHSGAAPFALPYSHSNNFR